MNNHHCTCEECERRRRRAGDEAFADLFVLAHFHPEWFMLGDTDVHHDHHDHHDGGLDGNEDVEHDHDDGLYGDDMLEHDHDDLDGFGMWD